MADKKVEVVISAIDQTQSAFNALKRSLTDMQGKFRDLSGEGVSASNSIAGSWGKTATAFAAGGVLYRALDALAGKFRQITVDATNYLATIETSTLGIAAAFMAGGRYTDQTTGKVLQGQDAMKAAMGDSKAVIEQLKVANMQTTATLDQLIRAYQETLPVALAKGFNRDQVLQFTQAMVQAAGAIGLPFEQLGEETRSLLTGSINPRNSRIATVLGLRNEDLKPLEGNAQALFDFLMQKLDSYRVAGLESQKTWEGLWSNWKDIQNQGLGQMFEGLFETIKYELQAVSSQIVTIDTTTKEIKWNPSFLETVQEMRTNINSLIAEIYRMGMLLDKVGGTFTAANYYVSSLGAKMGISEKKHPFLAFLFGSTEEAGRYKQYNDLFKSRYTASDKALQAMAYREMGLDENGNPAKKPPASGWTPNPHKPPVDKNAAKKANQDAIAAAELNRSISFGESDLRKEQNLEATKEWLRQRKILFEQEQITEEQWIEDQRTSKEEEAIIAAEAAREKLLALNSEWRAKRDHLEKGKELDRAYLQYEQQFDKLELERMKAGNAEKAAVDDAAVAAEKLRKKQEKEAKEERLKQSREAATAMDLSKARQLAEIETLEAEGAINATEAQRRKLAVLQEIVALEEARLDELPRLSAEEQIAWNQQAAKVEGVKKQVAELNKLLRLREGWEGMRQALQEYADAAANLGGQIQNATTNTLKGLEDALVNFAKTSKLSFRDLVDSIIADLARIVIRKTITGPLADNLDGWLKTGVGFLGGLFGGGATEQALGGAWLGGVQKFAAGGLVLEPTFFKTARGMGLMGESGPEAIMPLVRTASGHLGVRGAGGGGVSVNVPITVDGGSKRMIADLRSEIENTVVRVVRRHS